MKFDRKFKAMVSNTHVDLQNEAMAKSALESMVTQSENRVIWINVEHDPKCPPIGRNIRSWIEPLEYGHWGLYSEQGIFALNSFRQIPALEIHTSFIDQIKTQVNSKDSEIFLEYPMHEFDDEIFEIESIAGIDVVHRKVGQKSVDPPWWILIVVSPLVESMVNGFVTGFFGKSLEELSADFGSLLNSKLGEVKEKIFSAYQKSKRNSTAERKYYIMLEVKIGDSNCRAIVDLHGIEKSEVMACISHAESNFASFLALSADFVNKNPRCDALCFVFVQETSSWVISFAYDSDGEVYLGEFGRDYLAAIYPRLPQ
jgi:hypothetical protein